MPSTVQRILRRAGLPTRRKRLEVLEANSAERAGLLTDRSRRALARARSKRRHVEARHPGELMCLDSFYIGKLKGVGKVWQLTACDAASSYGAALVLASRSAVTARQAQAFLQEVLIPFYQKADWPIQRVLTDGGSEFKGAFASAYRELGIRQTRIRPRHAWTNGSSNSSKGPWSTSTGGSSSAVDTSPGGDS